MSLYCGLGEGINDHEIFLHLSHLLLEALCQYDFGSNLSYLT